jgi:hypothetical protein
MGEQSYFHRKFYANKFKRTKVASPGADEPAAASKQPPSGQQQPQPSRSQSAASGRLESEPAPAGSPGSQTGCEAPVSATARPSHQDRSDDADRQDDSPPPPPASTSADGEPCRVPPIASASANTSNDHIETLNFHPDTQSVGTSETSETNNRRDGAKQSRLSKASRAILLFRRATSSLSSVGSHAGGSQSAAGYKQSRSFVAALWPRQNTADNSTCTRSSRGDSLATDQHQSQNYGQRGPKNSSYPSLASFFNGGASGAAATANQAGSAQSPSSSSFGLPRFIVPKTNALKLPIVCLIKSLDDELMREIFVHRYELGQYLIDNLKVSLGMGDEKYFGLKMASSLDEQEDVRRPWLDLNEPVYKQISRHGRPAAASEHQTTAAGEAPPDGATKSVKFYLRIKFYPPNLSRVQDQFLKQYLWLQLRRDLRLGKLTSSMNNLTYLMACVLQYELGDYKNELVNERLPTMNILPNQDLIEQQAIDIWQHRLVGAKRHLVLMQFLRASVILETYGFDYYPVRDHQRQRAYLLGFNYAGIKTIRNGRIVNHFRWHNLSKISYERRMIIFHIYPNENSKRKQILGFKCLSNDECQNLYLRLLEQKYFFTVDLTYFDSSVRRPSHLNDSLFGYNDQQQLQPPPPVNEWPSAASDAGAGGGGSNHQQAELAEDDEEAEDECGPPAEPARRRQSSLQMVRSTTAGGPDGMDAISLRRLHYQTQRRTLPEDGATSKSTTIDSSSPYWHSQQAASNSSYNWQSSVDTTTTTTPPPPPSERPGQRAAVVGAHRARPAGGMAATKSSSLQEPGHCDPIGCQQMECLSQPSSPSSSGLRGLACCERRPPPAVAVGRPLSQRPSTLSPQPCLCCAATAHHARLNQQPALQRQCSFAQYTPDYEHDPAAAEPARPGQFNSLPEGRVASPSLSARIASVPDEQPDLHEHGGRHQASCSGVGAETDKRPPSAGQRLASWTEQLFVQPPPIQPSRQQHQPQPQPVSSPTNGLLMQAVRLCLLILFMNFMLRLSDGLSSLLIDLLSFGSQESASAGASRRPSMFGAPSGG